MKTQTRIGVGSITFHRRGFIRDQQMHSLHLNLEICTHFYFQLLFVGNSASHFLEMIMLIS